MAPERLSSRVLLSSVDVVAWPDALHRVVEWGRARESRVVVAANVHVVVSAARDPVFRAAVEAADLVCPDGSPIAWMLRMQGHVGQQRISGPDLMWRVCERCALEGIAVYFYGSTRRTLDALVARVQAAFPTLRVVGAESPPFRQLSEAETTEAEQRLNASGAGVVFVGLGCPKQEHWMQSARGRVGAVMLGVGAAFDFHAGTISRAPKWMRDHGLEWLHRVCSEPRRLWRRYLVTNTLFVLMAARQLMFGPRAK